MLEKILRTIRTRSILMSHQSSQATVKEIQNMNQIKPKLDKACFKKGRLKLKTHRPPPLFP